MIVEIVLFLITSIFGYFIYKYKSIHSYFDNNGIRYVPGYPIFGNSIKSTFSKKHMIEDVDAVYKAFPSERYVGYIEATTPIILVRDPELMKTITIKDFDYFTDKKQFFPQETEPLFGAILILMRGDKWNNMRSTLSPAFTSTKMRTMMPFMTQISSNIINHLQENINEEINIEDVIQRYTTDVIASTAYGLQVNSLVDKDNEFYKTGQNLFKFNILQRIAFLISMVYPKIATKLGIKVFPAKTSNFFRDIAVKTMEYRKKNNVQRPDMIQLLIETSKEWTEDEFASQILTFFIAGFDTVSSVLAMCIHELALNPEVQEKLYQEIKQFEEEHGDISYENLGNLKYLDCVLNESQRKWSAALFMDRMCTKPYELPPPREGGKPVKLKPGDLIYNVVNPVHMDPAHHPEPDKFLPERFSEENKHKIKSFTFMPFGMGPRNCLGSRFALLEIKVLLYNLFMNFKVVKCSKTTDPIQLNPHDFSVQCKGGSWVKLERRP